MLALGLLMVQGALAFDAAALSRSLEEYALQTCRAESARVQTLGLAQAANIPDGAQLAWEGDPCRSHPYVRLLVSQDGVLVSRINLRPSMLITVEVPVATKSAQKGDMVETRPGLVLVSDLRGAPLQAGTWQATTSIHEGEPLTDLVARARPDVQRGQELTLVARRGSVVLTADGRALEDANVGDTVRVMNEQTKVALRGELQANRVVLLR